MTYTVILATPTGKVFRIASTHDRDRAERVAADRNVHLQAVPWLHCEVRTVPDNVPSPEFVYSD